MSLAPYGPAQSSAFMTQGMVATVRSPSTRRPFGRVIVPVKGDDDDLLVHDAATALAQCLSIGVHVFHVTPQRLDADDEGALFGPVWAMAVSRKVPVEATVLIGNDVIAELLDVLDPHDLVVMGTRRLSEDYYMGSVARRLISRAPCPIQVMRLDP